jgi:hypothetical protein
MNTPEDAGANGGSLKDELYSSAVGFAQSALRAFLDKDFPTCSTRVLLSSILQRRTWRP